MNRKLAVATAVTGAALAGAPAAHADGCESMRAQTYAGTYYPKIEVCMYFVYVSGTPYGRVREVRFEVHALEPGKGVGRGLIYFTPKAKPPSGIQKYFPYVTANLGIGQTTVYACRSYSGQIAVNTNSPCGFYPGPDTASAGYPEPTRANFAAVRTDQSWSKTIDGLDASSFKA